MKGVYRILPLVILLGVALGACSLRPGQEQEMAAIPVYPSAELMKQQDDSENVTAEYLAHASLAKVAEFYRTRPADSGWQVAATVSDTHFSYYYVSRKVRPAEEAGKARAAEGYTLDVWLREEGQATIISIQRTFHSPTPVP